MARNFKELEAKMDPKRRARVEKRVQEALRKPLSRKLQAELDALAKMPDKEIDTTDMPPITDWSNAVRGRD